MSESLAWEKWSAFTHNKYREEAERYSRPGSVAEKKAFFEARYKKIAAKKAAASIEQQQSAAVNDHSSDVSRVNQNCDNGSVGSESAENAKHVNTEEMQGEEISNAELSVTDGCYQETAVSKQSTEQPIISKNQMGSMKQQEVDRDINKDIPCQDEKMDTKVCLAMSNYFISVKSANNHHFIG